MVQSDMLIKNSFLLIAVCLATSSCANFKVEKYQTTFDNRKSLQRLKNSSNLQFNVKEFVADEKIKQSLQCRGLVLDIGRPIGNYITEAFEFEFSTHGILNLESAIEIGGKVTSLESNNGFQKANWKITTEIKTNVFLPFEVIVLHEFSGTFMGDAACKNSANEFPAAVSKLINKTITHPKFQQMIAEQKTKRNKIDAKFEKSDSGIPPQESAAVAPIAALGGISDIWVKIIQNHFLSILSNNFQLISQKEFLKAQESAFQELDADQCTEDSCIIKLQELLQVEKLFILQIIKDTNLFQITVTMINSERRLVKSDFCKECDLSQIGKKTEALVKAVLAIL